MHAAVRHFRQRVPTRALILLLAALTAAFGSAPSAAQSFQSAAPYAVLMDAESGAILYDKAADELMSPASMAKLATVLVAFEEIRQGRLKLDDEIVISENAWRKGGAGGSGSGSTMFAALGSRVKLSDLLTGLIVLSGNDAAIALAEAVAGTEEAFARLMTERARAIGLTRSVFRNASGMPDPQQRVTARELARLAEHLIATYPEQYRTFGLREFTWNKIRQQNRNPLLAMEIGADGLKTGNIEESGFGLVGSALQNGQRLIVVVNGLKNGRDRAQEARKLLEWGFRSFEPRELFAAGEIIGEAQVFGGEKSGVALRAKGSVRLLVPRGSGDRILARIVYTGPVAVPVEEGKPIGRLLVTRGEVKALDLPLYAAETVRQGSLQKRALDAALELSTGWVRRAFGRDR